MREVFVKIARKARLAMFTWLRTIGALELIASSAWRRRRLLVLCYHGVSIDDEHVWDPELFVTPAFLRRRFEILRDGRYAVLPLGEAIDRCQAGTLPPKSVVITFDDGMADFAQIVAPMLREFAFPATVYVTTYYSEKQWPVTPPIFNYLLWKAGDRVVSLDWPELGLFPDSGGNLVDRRWHVFLRLLEFATANNLSGFDRWKLTQSLAERLGVNLLPILQKRLLHIMNSQEITEVASAGADIQLHTHRHRVPSDFSEFEKEIEENRLRLEHLSGRGAHDFCYPSGIVFRECLPWLKALGVRSAVTCEPGVVTQSTNPLLIPRFVDTSGQPEIIFEAWLSGAGALLRAVTRAEIKASTRADW